MNRTVRSVAGVAMVAGATMLAGCSSSGTHHASSSVSEPSQPSATSSGVSAKAPAPTGTVKGLPGEATTVNVAHLPADRVYVPSIGLYAKTVKSGTKTTSTGTYLDVPTVNTQMAWYSASQPVSSNTGNTVLAGHVTYNGKPGVLLNLHNITANSVIYVSDDAGHVKAFRATSKMVDAPKDSLPNWVFNPKGARTLTLVTCDGKLGQVNGPQGSYTGHVDNGIVQATPVAVG